MSAADAVGNGFVVGGAPATAELAAALEAGSTARGTSSTVLSLRRRRRRRARRRRRRRRAAAATDAPTVDVAALAAEEVAARRPREEAVAAHFVARGALTTVDATANAWGAPRRR